jgi:hypothetical protein
MSMRFISASMDRKIKNAGPMTSVSKMFQASIDDISISTPYGVALPGALKTSMLIVPLAGTLVLPLTASYPST